MRIYARKKQKFYKTFYEMVADIPFEIFLTNLLVKKTP